MLSFGKSLTRRSHLKLARKTFSEILQKQEDSINNTVFEYMWTYIVEGDYKNGLKVVEKYQRRIDHLSQDSRLSFWVGFSHLRQGRDKKAVTYFRKLIQENPLSYYSILSAKILSEDHEKKDTKQTYLSLVKKKRNIASQNTLSFNHRWLKRVLAWSRVSNSSLLRLELKSILGTMDESSTQTHLVAAAYKLSKSKNYLDSFKVIYRFVDQGIIDVNEDVLRILFPTPYYNQLRSKTKNFDPVIALSLIRQESGFNRYARSHVGARGLMQLMPGTARRFKRKVSTRQLYNPNLNIQIGTKYFSKLMDLFNDNLVYSLAAYNAGENRIKDWKSRSYVDNSEPMLENIENIPFYETRKYVKLIFRNIFFYKMLTEGEENKDSHNLNKIYDIHLGFNK
jgi:soluble lytic murein transglycosylase